jgi:FKBP-type peptidyl-prolyl cis-trans isomerase
MWSLLFLAFMFVAVASGADTSADKMANYNKRVGKKFLEEVAAKPGVLALKSGMFVEILQASTQKSPKSPTASDQCEVTYKGTLKNGEIFDEGTTSFAPNQVIKGWTEAMQLMVEGDKWKLYIPYDLAYGERGAGGKIGPYATLVFEIEIHKVKSGGKSQEEAKTRFQEALLNAKTADL